MLVDVCLDLDVYILEARSSLFNHHIVMNASDIISALPGRFEAAKSSGDLFFFPSEVNKHEEIGVEVCCHSLLSSQSTHSPYE